MPELPEVETMCRGISAVQGATIDAVVMPRCRYRPIEIRPRTTQIRKRIVGCQIVAIERIGKRPILRFDSGDRLIFEPRMTGLLLVDEAPDREHLRMGLQLRGCSVPTLWFWDRRGLGKIRLLSTKQMTEHLGPDKIGPDALQLTAEMLQQRLSASQREIKVALLDQKIVAGIGNLYASEILHVAGVHPRKRCRQITGKEWRRIVDATLDVLHEAIQYEGSTLNDGTFRNALNQDGSYQNHHRVYMRGDEMCFRCEAKIRRIVQAQRSTFFCPACQAR